MKKIIAILLALAAVLSLAACGNNSGTTETETTTSAPAYELTGSLEDIANQIIEKTTKIEMMLMPPTEVDFSDVEAAQYYIGVDPTGKVAKAVFVEPMIGSIPFSMCIIEGAEGAKIEDLKNEILEGVNYRKWVCVAAEKVLVSSCGNKILMIMSTEEIVDDVYSAFLTITQNSASAPITKAGEVNEEPPVDGGVADDMGGIADMEIPADMPAYDGETLE